MKNIHLRLFLVILALMAGSIWVVVKKPIRKGLDIQGGMRVVLRAQTEKLPKGGVWNQDKLETVANIMRRRVDSLGVAEPVVYPQGSDRVVVELPGVRDKARALEVITTTAKLEFRYVTQLESEWHTEPDMKDGRETGFERILGPNGPVSEEELKDKVFSEEPVLTGADLEPNSRPDLSPKGYIIHFEFKPDKKGEFETFTRTHIGKRLAIFLDQKLISAPTINEVIPGVGIIEGRFTSDQAKTLANNLNAGALPVPLEQLDFVTVEATLGNAAVKQTVTAGIVGLAGVLIFMAAFYLVPGLIADLALGLYALFTFAIFKGAFEPLGLPAITLTVPGIAGFILSIGMAVDANILIFERMKEERKTGKSMRAAIETGFKRAFSAIFDSNVCTLITCAILYHFGTGQVRGFAVTLAIGVLISMFTAITCSRTFLLMLANTALGQNDAVYGLNRGFHPRLNVTKRMMTWFAISGAVIVPGLIFWAMGGIKKSIEFTGGAEFTVQFAQPVSPADINSTLRGIGIKESRVVLAEGNRAYITVPSSGQSISQDERDKVTAAIKEKGGTVGATQVVGGTISGELIKNAIYAVLFASVAIILYLAIRFSIPNFIEGLKYGTCAVIALLHDVFVLWGLFAILGYLLNWQIDSLFVTAMLTVIGFSVHDTIIIFDRIRENLHHRARGESFDHVADRSIEQTFARSVNTSGTVVLTLLALLFFGGPVIRLFVVALLFGIVSGTYSSIFNATPLLVLWKRLSGDTTGLATAPAGGAAAPGRASTARSAGAVARPAPARKPVTPAAPTVAPTTPSAAAPTATVDGDGTAAGADRLRPKAKKKTRRM